MRVAFKSSSLFTRKQILVRILVVSRKAIVYINAAIGVYVVFKTVGFSTDNIFAGFVALGHEYVLIMQSGVKRLFNWFVELFDYKVIPNVPDNPPMKPYKPNWSGPHYNRWYTKPMNEHSFIDIGKYKDLYKNPFNINIEVTPWYRDWSTLLWIAGGICTIGIGYICYQSYYDPMYIVKQIWGPMIRETGPTPPDVSGTPVNPPIRSHHTFPKGPEIVDQAGNATAGPSTIASAITGSIASGTSAVTGSIASGTSIVTKGLVSSYKYTMYKLNPFNWVDSAAQQQANLNAFIMLQNEPNTVDFKLYPFTNNNPCDSWLKRLRVHYLGETFSEFTERMDLKFTADTFYRENIECRTDTTPSSPVVETMGSEIWSAPKSGTTTPTPRSPMLGSVGLSGLKGFQSSSLSTIVSQVQGMPDASSTQIETIKTITAPSSPILPTNEAWASVEKSAVVASSNTPIAVAEPTPLPKYSQLPEPTPQASTSQLPNITPQVSTVANAQTRKYYSGIDLVLDYD